MQFSSAEYPIFLIAVFFMYGLLRAGKWPATVARLILLLLLGDLVYLLLTKDVGSLWDPVGALAYRALARDPPPLHSVLELGSGAAIFVLSVALGVRNGARLDGARGQARIAALSAVLLVGMGLAIRLTWGADSLDGMTAGFAGVGHLLWLGLYGLAVGAASTRAGRHFGRLLTLFLVSAIFYHSWAVGMPGAYKYLLLLILGTIVLDYYLALWIHRTADPTARLVLVIVSLCSNLGVLALFKYFDFFLATTKAGAGWFGMSLAVKPFALILPAGISFHTFQSLSYTIDVYKKRIQPTRSVLTFAAFVLFFPQLVAGPIVRADEFLPQLDQERAATADRAAWGLFRILTGLFKKIALADMLALLHVDRVFKQPKLFSGLEVLFAVYGYAFQIYLDFSAYSDIAIGSAALLGFEFPENFRTPYRSANLQDFWRRWHITLSSWLRDYLYIPLGGSRSHTYRNLLITMLLGGLWHGGNWTFIVWGALHGGGLAVTRIFQRLRERDPMRARVGHRIAWAVATACLYLHVTFAGAIGGLGARVGLDLDPAWIHLILAWAYLVPAWASLTAWLSADEVEAPAAAQTVGDGPYRQSPPIARPTQRWRGQMTSALLFRLAFMSLSTWALTMVYQGERGDTWHWVPLVAGCLALACAGDIAEQPRSLASTLRYGAWAARRAGAMLLTFHYVCFAWVFFRATSFANARDVLTQIGAGATDAVNLSQRYLLVLAIAVAAHLFPPGTFHWLRQRFVAAPALSRAVVLCLATLLLAELVSPVVVPFIYFQF